MGPPDSADTPRPFPRSHARLVALTTTPPHSPPATPTYEFRPDFDDYAFPGKRARLALRQHDTGGEVTTKQSLRPGAQGRFGGISHGGGNGIGWLLSSEAPRPEGSPPCHAIGSGPAG